MLSTKKTILTLVLFFSIFISLQSSEESGLKNLHQLSSFGKTATIKDAQETFKNATSQIIANGGGTLFINSETCKDFHPDSITQERLGEKSVTIIDLREGKFRFILPSLGFRIPDNPCGYASFFLDREINQRAINIDGQNSILRMTNRLVSGSVSYFQPVKKQESTADSEILKIYPATIQGIYTGMEIYAWLGNDKELSGEVSASRKVTVRIEKIEWDKQEKLHYILARKLTPDDPWGKVSFLMNKATANCITINDFTNCDTEEAGTIAIEKFAFGHGDNFGIGQRYFYMGNVMSTQGDENGNAYTVDIWNFLYSFNGKVESWEPSTGKLVYTVDSDRVNTLATSRPLINLNPEKWLSRGKIVIEANWNEMGTIDPNGYVRGINTNWGPEIIGRTIAVDAPDEYCGNPSKGFWKTALKGRIVRRWWRITHYEKTSSGEDRLWVERIRHMVYDRAVPTLINENNYRKELSYVIAPCAMVSDVSEALLKLKKVEVKLDDLRATRTDKRTIGLLPAPDTGTKWDFEAGDPIEQAVGADPAHPNGYRVRHREAMPSNYPNSSSFYTVNYGAYPISAALAVHGGWDAMQVPGHSKFRHAVNVTTSCDYGIRFQDAVKYAALLMEKPEHKITWKTAKGNVSLSSSPDGILNIAGRGISVSGQPINGVKSISGNNSFGRNLRGIDIPVGNGKKELRIFFDEGEPDANYSLTVQPDWLCRWAVTGKTPQGFTVLFDEPASSNSKIDWQLIR